MILRIGVAAVFLLALHAGCRGDGGRAAVPGGERTFVFGMRGLPDAAGRFVAATSAPVVIAKLEAELALPAASRSLHINGPIARGNGGENLSWSWHFAPDLWDAVEVSVEVCDGTPAMVESDLDTWVDELGVFCPWGSYAQGEQ